MNAKLTVAGWLRVNEKVVPTGDPCRGELLSRHLRFDWATRVSVGGGRQLGAPAKQPLPGSAPSPAALVAPEE